MTDETPNGPNGAPPSTPELDALDVLADAGADSQARAAAAPATPHWSETVDPELVALVQVLLARAFGVFCPNWHVKPDEAQQLALPTAAVVHKYFPDLSLGVELTALIAWGMFLESRRGIPRKFSDEGEGGRDAA